MTHSEAGRPAALFRLQTTGGGELSIEAARGRPLVIFFYPKDDTKGCTVEALEFSALMPEFERAGVTVVGISPDDLRSHNRFRRKYGLSVMLAADPTRTAIEQYGLWAEKRFYGRSYMGVVRSTFLVDADGTISRVWTNVSVAGHAREVLDAALALTHPSTQKAPQRG